MMKIDSQTIINNIPDGLIVVDTKGKVVLTNSMADKIFGARNKKIIGSNIRYITKLSEVRKKIALSDTGNYKIKIKLDGKKPRVYKTIISPIHQKKEIIARIILIEDVTKEEFLFEAQKGLTSLMSERLQVPTNIIKSYLDMFMSGKARELPEEAQKLLTSAYQGNERLIRTINNVLDMIDLESSEIVIKKKKNVDVDNLIKNSISDFDEQANAKGINLTYKKSQKLPLLNINPLEIAKVIKHLLDNALRFTEKGSIIIFTRIRKNEVIVSVRDTGMGISKEDQKFLFQKFLKLSKPQKNQSANDELGLGLYICHTIVEKHGGKIWVESQKDRGSTFSFSLPLK